MGLSWQLRSWFCVPGCVILSCEPGSWCWMLRCGNVSRELSGSYIGYRSGCGGYRGWMRGRIVSADKNVTLIGYSKAIGRRRARHVGSIGGQINVAAKLRLLRPYNNTTPQCRHSYTKPARLPYRDRRVTTLPLGRDFYPHSLFQSFVGYFVVVVRLCALRAG